MIEFLKIALFCITFYFTIIRMLTWIKIFGYNITSLAETIGFKMSTFWSLLNLSMWCYQIFFWFHLLNII